MRKLFLTGVVALFGLAAPAGSLGAAVAASAPVIVHAPMIPGTTPPGVSGAAGAAAAAGKNTVTDVQSSNWSGYADTSDTYQTLSSSWVQPTATCTRTARKAQYAAFWVGLDGYSSDSVEQTGTDSDCTAAGQPNYYGWYEMYPAGSVDISTSKYPVKPGQTLTGSVTSNAGGTSFTMSLTDVTAGWTFSIAKSGSGLARSSAEWVAEAPSSCGRTCTVLPLADFGTVAFSKATTTDTGGHIGSISAFTASDIQMASGSTVKATPSALSANGSAFSVTWSHS
jgi:hypothetical protein